VIDAGALEAQVTQQITIAIKARDQMRTVIQ
jgi:hypothetical protein